MKNTLKNDIHFCDFCIAQMNEGEYETLTDGRERCKTCASTDLNTDEQVINLFKETQKRLKKHFDICIKSPIKIVITDAKFISEKSYIDLDGPDVDMVKTDAFEASAGLDSRIVSFVERDDDGFVIYVEYGAPRLVTEGNFVYNLTYIWQCENWCEKLIEDSYGLDNIGLIYQGMSSWIEIQYMYLQGETEIAERYERYYEKYLENDDPSRLGFLEYKSQYPLAKSPSDMLKTPFQANPPLSIPLKQMLNKRDIIDIEYFDDPIAHYCDFCAAKMYSDFEVLGDGREICDVCFNYRLRSEAQFQELLEFAISKMRTFFGIDFSDTLIQIDIIAADELKKKAAEFLKPTAGYDPRSIALAVQSEMKIYIEKGAPKNVAIAYIVHELTNIWQYKNWDLSEIIEKYGANNAAIIYEGMAVWAEIQFMYLTRGIAYAKRREVWYEKCAKEGSNSPYVLGFKEYTKQYPFKYDPKDLKVNPFQKFPPLKTPIEYGVVICDFCGKKLLKDESDTLSDGRDQCGGCQSTAIKEMDDRFYQLYGEVFGKMEQWFKFEFAEPPLIKVVNTKQIAKLLGKKFVPTTDFDKRTPAVVEKKRGWYFIYFEDNIPQIQNIGNIASALTQLWQIMNWNIQNIKGENDDSLIVKEGMAMWASIQFLCFFYGQDTAFLEAKKILADEDKYSWGLYNYMKEYPFVKKPEDLSKSPFDLKTPLTSIKVEKPTSAQMLNLLKEQIEPTGKL